MKTLLPLLLVLFTAPAHAETFDLEITDSGLVGEEALAPTDISWNECSGNVTGNYTGYKCVNQRKMAEEFRPFLMQNAVKCTNAGLDRLGLASVSSIHLIHDGVQADSAHSSRSLHALGRAIDIQQVKAGGRSFDFRITSRQPNSADRKFYEGFRACWNNLMIARGCPRRQSGAPVGTIGWEDKKHINHHLHTSLPYCPSSRGYFTTSFTNDVEEDAEEEGNYVEFLDI